MHTIFSEQWSVEMLSGFKTPFSKKKLAFREIWELYLRVKFS